MDGKVRVEGGLPRDVLPFLATHFSGGVVTMHPISFELLKNRIINRVSQEKKNRGTHKIKGTVLG